jgi:hypothetical protein
MLDAARQVGDPHIDAVVADYLAGCGGAALGPALGALFGTTGLPEAHPLVRAYLARVDEPAPGALGDPARIERGQRMFGRLGPELLLVLGSCSLPLAFACGNGVQAIHRARRLKDDPLRRLYDTAQMVVNAMQVGGLARGGIGWRSARKVRLIHAVIRHQVQRDPAAPWSASWGTAINQEDMAGTLLSFSVAALHGLRRIGARISRAEGDDYVHAWSAVGRLLGVDERLLVDREADAMALALRIGARQIRATPEGKQLAEQLLEAVGSLLPVPGYALSLTHYFLSNTAFGDDVARVLELAEPDWTRALVAARAWQKRHVLRLLDLVPGAHGRRRFLARRFVQALISARRPAGDAPPFEVPARLAMRWR